MRFVGLDVHRDFCEIAICEHGRVQSGGRVATSPEGLQILADSLGPEDHVALEATGNARAIARTLEPHAARVVVAARNELRAITEAKVKTDGRDARTLARLLAAGLLHGCWLPDEPTRALRRRLARRAQLVRQRTRAKNELHAALMRNLTEIALLERGIAEHALGSQAIKRLMTVPGVSLMTATTFIAAVGDIRRFPDPRKLVSYLGLDPKVRQSGAGAAHHGRISKQGAAQVRQMLTEAAIVAVNTPGPMRAFYERVRTRRGSQIAIVAVARKLAVLFWHLLTREQDYAFQRPSLTRKKLRSLELLAGAERHPGRRDLPTKNAYSQRTERARERELAEQAEVAYRRLVADWKAARSNTTVAMT